MVFLDDAQYSAAVITTPTPSNPDSSSSANSSATSKPDPKGAGGALGLNAPLTTAFGVVLSLVTLTFFSL